MKVKSTQNTPFQKAYPLMVPLREETQQHAMHALPEKFNKATQRKAYKRKRTDHNKNVFVLFNSWFYSRIVILGDAPLGDIPKYKNKTKHMRQTKVQIPCENGCKKTYASQMGATSSHESPMRIAIEG